MTPYPQWIPRYYKNDAETPMIYAWILPHARDVELSARHPRWGWVQFKPGDIVLIEKTCAVESTVTVTGTLYEARKFNDEKDGVPWAVIVGHQMDIYGHINVEGRNFEEDAYSYSFDIPEKYVRIIPKHPGGNQLNWHHLQQVMNGTLKLGAKNK